MKKIAIGLLMMSSVTSYADNKTQPPIPIVGDIVKEIVEEQKQIILTPDQIEELKKTISAARKENVVPYPNKSVAKPVNRALQVDPDATKQPRMIRLSSGMITSLVFSDMNGNPWLVQSTRFDKNLFSDGDQAGKERNPTNIISIWPEKPYSYGNIVVELEGLPSPITFLLATGQSDEVDITINARIAGHNPNAKPQLIAFDKMPEHDDFMGYFLDGVPPKGAKKLDVTGNQAEAWALNGALYLRTRVSVLSPAFKNHVGSADGMHVYKFFSLIPSILVSVNGKPSSLSVSGF